MKILLYIVKQITHLSTRPKRTNLNKLMKRPDKMTVGELIAKLQTFDSALPVMVDGYEGGVDYPVAVDQAEVRLNVNEPDYYGAHEEGNYHTARTRHYAVLIRR